MTAGEEDADEAVLRSSLAAALGDLPAEGEPLLLVVDDVHRLRGAGCRRALTALAEQLTPGSTLALAGRREPDLPLARLRVRGHVFELGPAFGSAPTLATALEYTPMSATHWCMDVADSPHYNRIVDAKIVGEAAVEGSTERMRLDLATPGDARYSQGFVIRHNPANVPGAGSCIFGHLWKAPDAPTAGCTAMTEAAMSALLGWLDPAAHPVLVLLPRGEYEKLRGEWALPDLSLANPHF